MFQLVRKREEKPDDTGKIQIVMRLMDKSKPAFPKKGNQSRTITVKDSKVSEVYAFIVKAMCAEEGVR